MAEISLGCICFNATRKLECSNFTKIGSLLINIIEILGLGIVTYCAYNYTQSDIDLSLILILAIIIILAFSQKGMFDYLFVYNNICSYLGSFSFQMYLMHELVKNVILPYLRDNLGVDFLQDISFSNYLCIYILVTIIFAFICKYLGLLLKKSYFFLYKLIFLNS